MFAVFVTFLENWCMRESHDDEVRDGATTTIKCWSIKETERLEKHRLHTVLGKASGSLFHQSTAITSVLRNRSAPSGFQLMLVSRKDRHSTIGNWRLHYNEYSRSMYTYITAQHQVTSNVRERESSARNRTCPWCPKSEGLRQDIRKENMSYRRSLHQAITAADCRGFQG
jgi:hypothetical protein